MHTDLDFKSKKSKKYLWFVSFFEISRKYIIWHILEEILSSVLPFTK